MSVLVDNVDISIRTAIGNLLLKAGQNELVKKVITAFDPSASRSVTITVLSSFNLNMLEPCAEFLNIDLADGDGDKIYTKDTLVARIRHALLALLPSQCSDCSSMYMVEFEPNDAPHYHCYMCFQGSHDCNAIKERYQATSATKKIGGSIWLCNDCLTNNNPVKPRKSKSRHASVSLQEPQPSSASHSRAASPETEKEEVTVQTKKRDPSDRVCQKYKTGKCPHGIRGNKVINDETCAFSHPKRCFKYCKAGDDKKYGCKKSKNCTYFHPKLCRSSVKTKVCTDLNCTFVHLKGTSRKDPPKEKRESPGDTRTNPPPVPENKVTPNCSSDFLELKLLIESMEYRYQQEMSSLKSSLSQQQLLKCMQMPPMMNRLQPPQQFPQMPAAAFHQQFQYLPRAYIPQSSC